MMNDRPSPARRWLMLPWIAVLSCLPVALATLVPVEIGYWSKAQPIVVWLHLCSGLGALGLAAGLAGGSQPIRMAVIHPYVLVPAAMALWTAIASLAVPFPLLSLAGLPQTGLGGVWFADLAVLVACCIAVRDDGALWRALAWAAALTVLGVAVLKLVDIYARSAGPSLLLYIPSYYAWSAVVLPVIWQAWTWGRAGLPVALAVAMVTILGSVASFSLTAWAVVLVGVALVAAGRRGEGTLVRRLADHRGLAVAAVAVAGLAIPLVLRGLSPMVDSASLLDRIHLQDMVGAALRTDPAWVMGHGWGRIQDAFHAHLNVTGENLWKPTWIFLSSDYFSAHNWILDTVHAVGLPGVMLQLAGFVVLPWCAAQPARPAATALALALAVIMGVWFVVGFSLPFFAMAMAAVAAPPSRRPQGPVVWGAAMVLLGLAVAQIGVSSAVESGGRAVSAARADFRADQANGVPWPRDFRGSDLEAAESIRDAFGDLAKAGGSLPGKLPAVRAMVELLRSRIPETGTVQLPMTGLGVMAYIYLSRDLAWLEPEIPDGRHLWRAWVDRLLTMAPGRTDQAIAYLSDRAAAGDLWTVAQVCNRILRHNPSDPVGLYFTGLHLVLAPDLASKQQGIEAFRAARRAGIERFMPLDPAIIGVIGPP